MAATPKGRKPEPHKSPPAKPAATKKAAGVAASAPAKAAPDWERIELDYRAAIKTLRQIADENGITHGAINKRARRDGWERDLSEKIAAKADALVSKAAVSTEVSKEARIAEKQVVDANAQAVASVRLEHRKDIHRGRRIANALFDELEKPRRRRRPGPRRGVQRALAARGLHQEVEIHAGRPRGAPNGRLHAACRGNRSDRHNPRTLCDRG